MRFSKISLSIIDVDDSTTNHKDVLSSNRRWVVRELHALPTASIQRRSIVMCLFVILAFSLLFLDSNVYGADSNVGDENWAMFRHDLSHSGSSPSTAPNTSSILWNYTTSGGVVWSSPAVADGKVYIGSNDNRVYCLNSITGAGIWSYITGGIVDSSPAVADAKVYVGSNDNRIYCLNATTGMPIWNFTTGLYVCSSPAVADGKVYIGSDDKKIYCLNSTTGAHIWNYTTGDMLEVASPAVVDGKVYVGSMDFKVYCLNAATGEEIWNYKTGGYVWSSPAVANGKVYVGSEDFKVYCLDAETGAYVWNYTTGNPVRSSPAVNGDKVYVGSYDHTIYCLNAATGAYIWNYKTGANVNSSPAVVDGKVYVGSGDKNVYCLNAATGAYIWSYATGRDVLSSPAIVDGKVYVGSWDGRVYCFASSNSTPSPVPTPLPPPLPNQTGPPPPPPQPTKSPLILTPVDCGGYLYNGRTNDTLVCFFSGVKGVAYFSFNASAVPKDAKIESMVFQVHTQGISRAAYVSVYSFTGLWKDEDYLGENKGYDNYVGAKLIDTMGISYSFPFPSSDSTFNTIKVLPVTLELESSLAGINQYTQAILFDSATLTISYTLPANPPPPPPPTPPPPNPDHSNIILIAIVSITLAFTAAITFFRKKRKSEPKQTVTNADDPYSILGISRNATHAEVKDSFFRLSKEWHPDKFFRHDDPRVSEMANEKYLKIKGAYEQILREMHWT